MTRPFVGRGPELAALEAAVRDGAVVRVVGPTGIGKGALIRRFSRGCGARDVPIGWADPKVDEVTRASLVAQAAEIEAARRTAGAPFGVLVVLAMHRLRALERWIALRFALDLPPTLRLVLSDRHPGGPLWYEASAAAVREIPIGPLSPAEVAEFLEGAGVAQEHRAAIAELAGGSPLLLTLASRGSGPPSGQDILIRLAGHVCAECDTPEHRLAFATLLSARATTFELLAHVLGDTATAEGTFRWLQSLSVVDETPLGLQPHEVVRRACAVQLETHHSDLSLRAQLAVRAFVDAKVLQAPDPLRWIEDRLWLERRTETFRPFFGVGASAGAAEGLGRPGSGSTAGAIEPLREDDLDGVAALAEEGGGSAYAALVRRAMEERRLDGEVLRAGKDLLGFVAWRELQAGCVPAADDALLRALGAHLERARVAPGARVLAIYGWGAAGARQGPGPSSARLCAAVVRRLLQARDLSLHVALVQQPDFWLDLLAAVGLSGEPAGTLDLGGRKATLLAFDWRGRSFREFLEQVSQRTQAELRDRATNPPPPNAGAEPDLGDLVRRRIEEIAKRARLTAREREVLDLLSLGRNTQEIGVALGITPRTAKFHQENVLSKIGADSKLDILRLLL